MAKKKRVYGRLLCYSFNSSISLNFFKRENTEGNSNRKNEFLKLGIWIFNSLTLSDLRACRHNRSITAVRAGRKLGVSHVVGLREDEFWQRKGGWENGEWLECTGQTLGPEVWSPPEQGHHQGKADSRLTWAPFPRQVGSAMTLGRGWGWVLRDLRRHRELQRGNRNNLC